MTDHRILVIGDSYMTAEVFTRAFRERGIETDAVRMTIAEPTWDTARSASSRAIRPRSPGSPRGMTSSPSTPPPSPPRSSRPCPTSASSAARGAAP